LFRSLPYLSGAEFILHQHHIDRFDKKNSGGQFIKTRTPFSVNLSAPSLLVVMKDFVQAVLNGGSGFFDSPLI